MSPLSRHPDEAVSHGMYRAMVEQRNDARAIADELADALERAVRRGEESGHLLPIQDAALLAQYRASFPRQRLSTNEED